jgi:hypothetical protein
MNKCSFVVNFDNVTFSDHHQQQTLLEFQTVCQYFVSGRQFRCPWQWAQQLPGIGYDSIFCLARYTNKQLTSFRSTYKLHWPLCELNM